MKKKMIVIILLFACNIVSISTATTNDLKLELIQVLFRHGDRYPSKYEIETTGLDTLHKQFEHFEDFSQLTKKGMMREYKLGRMLRLRYNDFLGEFKYKEVVARSTNVDRAKMSLQCALAGLYPPTKTTAWSDEILWTPIPTVYEPVDIDFLRISFTGPCMRNKQILIEAENSSVILGKLAKYKGLENKIVKNTKIKVLTPETGFTYHSYIAFMKSMGYTLPEYLTEEDLGNLAEVSGLFFEALTLTEEGRRGIVGPTVDQMLKNIEENQVKKRKIILYSAHDTNVGPFVKAHNITNIPPVPEFGSAVIIEQLRDSKDNIYLKMFYWTGISEELILVKLENCENPCLLSKYTEIVKPMIPNEEQKYCYSLKKYCDDRT